MKKVFTFFMIFMAVAFISNTNAQTCTPDHTGYTVVPDAGILLPTTLPNATVGVPYTASITIGVPGTAQTYPVNWIQYKSSTNFISTNTWTVVDSVNLGVFPKWPKLTWHCGIIKGTPATAGTDSIRIFVDANVTVFGFPFTQANVKAFTLPLIVDVNTGIENNLAVTTKLIAGRPNPFKNSTKIGIMAERTEKATLNVYSILGQMVYSEAKTITPGENFFDFTGTDLSNGTYIYTVITSEKMFNEKLIKTE
jgi:hypothetical protein